MNNDRNERKPDSKVTSDSTAKPDPGTLHTTDPQEHMKGPISSLMHETGEAFDSDETRAEADAKKEKDM